MGAESQRAVTVAEPGAAAVPWPARTPAAPMRLLILAATYALPYRVMRCARQAGAETYVLGNLGAQVLTLSRCCRRFVLAQSIIAGHYDADLAVEINCLARDLGIAMILPGDAPSTRALIACRHLLEVPCFPLPDLAAFDLLNDKWRFAQLCANLGVCHPETRLFPDATALGAAIAEGAVAWPVVAKALSLSAGRGLVVLDGPAAAEKVRQINYRPIVVQQYIPGREIGASVYCRESRITAFIAHDYRRRVYSTFRSAAIFADIERLMAHVGADGVYNFDMIAADDGSIHYLECNPRFFYKINLSMLAGINFVALGLDDEHPAAPLCVPDGTTVRLPEAVLTSPRSWFHLSRHDWAATGYTLADSVSHAFNLLGWPT